jgi:hypothetical protein
LPVAKITSAITVAKPIRKGKVGWLIGIAALLVP